MKQLLTLALLFASIFCQAQMSQKEKNAKSLPASEKSVFSPLRGEFSVCGRDPISYWIDTTEQIFSRADFNECPVFVSKKDDCIYATRVIKIAIDTTYSLGKLDILFYNQYKGEGTIALGSSSSRITNQYEIEQVGDNQFRVLLIFPEGDEEFLIDTSLIMHFIPAHRRRFDSIAQTIEYRTYAGQNNLILSPITTKL